MTVTIRHGDCREVLLTIADESVHCALTSPPYNVGKPYEQRADLDSYIEEQAQIISECVRILRPGGSICWQVGNYVRAGEVFPLDIVLYRLFKERGLKLRNRIIWHFGHGLHCSKRLSGRHETVLWFTKGDDYTFNLDPVRVPSKYPGKKHFKGPKKGQLSGNPLGKNPTDVWDIPNVKHNHPEKTEHPCQFPEELVERLILATTFPGDTVLDPFAGSGTTGAVAARLGRNAALIESNEDYVAIAEHRLNDAEVSTDFETDAVMAKFDAAINAIKRA